MEEEIYANADFKKTDDRGPCINPTGLRRFQEAVVLSLVLLSVLLLAVLIGLSVHCHNSAHEFSSIKTKLQASDNQLSTLTEKLQCLKKTCPNGWKMFGCSCYLFSIKAGSWNMSRKECRARGADLVVINSLEEQLFVTDAKEKSTWIGLSDKDNEGTWKWTDGTLLTLSFWHKRQPDNGGGDPRYGEEDCVHLVDGRTQVKNWNDMACHRTLYWICEK
ncbi:CD209 antigen-like protein E [Notolabrus celidotus]|uniref:CD209 antigen-like protein E n=1 Tax=Notolabrus celidotus TaxID=1203425 RepID=UPI00148FCE3D|nr:CD209 antigen-like protein E [Notolabrus celidotus]